MRTEQLVIAAAQLCHMDDALAHHTWLRMFPKLWTTMDERQLGVSLLYTYAETNTKQQRPRNIDHWVQSLIFVVVYNASKITLW